MLDKRKLVKAISLNCFHDGGESALSRPVGRSGAVWYTGDHRKSVASELEKVIRVIAVLVDQRGNDSAGVRHPLDLRTSLQLVLDLFSAL